MRSTARSIVGPVALGFGVVALFSLIALSPLFIDIVPDRLGIDSRRASEIGQSYGAISALISGFALTVLAASIAIQVRQTRTSQLFNARTIQLQLVQQALADPTLIDVLVGDDPQIDVQAIRRDLYRNMWFMYNNMFYMSGTHDEGSLRRNLADESFATPEGISHWERLRKLYGASITSRRDRAFLAIVNDEHSRAQKRVEGSRPPRSRTDYPGYI